jgi:hypothetical protein
MGITPFWTNFGRTQPLNPQVFFKKEIIFIDPKHLGHNNGLIRRGGLIFVLTEPNFGGTLWVKPQIR